MARLASKRIWKQWAESTCASGDDIPALGGDGLDWDEMPQVGSSFHWSLIDDRVDDRVEDGDLEALIGPEGAALFRPLGLESDDSLDGGEAGSVHYYRCAPSDERNRPCTGRGGLLCSSCRPGGLRYQPLCIHKEKGLATARPLGVPSDCF